MTIERAVQSPVCDLSTVQKLIKPQVGLGRILLCQNCGHGNTYIKLIYLKLLFVCVF